MSSMSSSPSSLIAAAVAASIAAENAKVGTGWRKPTDSGTSASWSFPPQVEALMRAARAAIMAVPEADLPAFRAAYAAETALLAAIRAQEAAHDVATAARAASRVASHAVDEDPFSVERVVAMRAALAAEATAESARRKACDLMNALAGF